MLRSTESEIQTLHQCLYRSDGNISDISTLISLISASDQSSNDDVKTL